MLVERWLLSFMPIWKYYTSLGLNFFNFIPSSTFLPHLDYNCRPEVSMSWVTKHLSSLPLQYPNQEPENDLLARGRCLKSGMILFPKGSFPFCPVLLFFKIVFFLQFPRSLQAASSHRPKSSESKASKILSHPRSDRVSD